MTIVALLSGAALAACGTTSESGSPAAACDSSKCAPGNTCLPLNGETKCRRTCSSNADPATSCPFGYTCTDTLTGAPPFCVQSTALREDGQPLEKKESGQWGASCAANLGFENPQCDTEQGFRCYGGSPTDGDAYCTRYFCEQDSDCGPGFWCGKINRTPNVASAKRGPVGEVLNVCLRRTYCSTCNVDLDCNPVAGKPQHCIEDTSGAKFCAPECESTQNCPNEARCVDVGVGAKVCYPRANVCVGDGSLCSPCRVDTDCGEDGACVKGQYTTEKACAKKSTSPCLDENDKQTGGSCPRELTEGSKASIGCVGTDELEEVPKDYCVGVYSIGSSADIGCWTPER